MRYVVVLWFSYFCASIVRTREIHMLLETRHTERYKHAHTYTQPLVHAMFIVLEWWTHSKIGVDRWTSNCIRITSVCCNWTIFVEKLSISSGRKEEKNELKWDFCCIIDIWRAKRFCTHTHGIEFQAYGNMICLAFFHPLLLAGIQILTKWHEVKIPNEFLCRVSSHSPHICVQIE